MVPYFERRPRIHQTPFKESTAHFSATLVHAYGQPSILLHPQPLHYTNTKHRSEYCTLIKLFNVQRACVRLLFRDTVPFTRLRRRLREALMSQYGEYRAQLPARSGGCVDSHDDEVLEQSCYCLKRANVYNHGEVPVFSFRSSSTSSSSTFQQYSNTQIICNI